MKTGRHLIPTFLAALLLTLAGCEADGHLTPEQIENSGFDVYLSLTLQRNDVTRANPNGGEQGDGTEEAVNNEDKIHSLTLFFYQSATGIEDNTDPALKRIDVPVGLITQSGNTYTTEPISVRGKLDLNTAYHMVVLANAAENGIDLDAITTLDKLKAGVATQAWTTATDVANYNNFLITSRYRSAADDPVVTVRPNNGRLNPAPIAATVCRVAARVDIVPMTATNGANYLADGTWGYNVSGTKGDKLILQGIKLVNRLSRGTYLLKHMAPANTDNTIDDDNLFWLGNEEPNSGIQTNYVVDPYTLQKTTETGAMIAGQAISMTYADYFTAAATNSWTAAEGLKKTTTSGDHYILGYTMENTMAKASQQTRYTTMLWFKAKYRPARWFKLVSGTLTRYTIDETEFTATDYQLWCYRDVFFNSWQACAEGIRLEEGVSLTTEAAVKAHTGVSFYDGGQCYYSYRIRHSNNEVTPDMGIMEFAIVRNNIYRITVNTFNGIGSPEPNTTNEDDEKLEVIIKVIPWEIIHHSIIYS